MAGSIKLFSFNRKYYHVFGIYPPQSNQKGPQINWRNWIFVIGFLLFSLPSAAFFILKANSMIEYGLSFMASTNAVFMMCIYLVMIWQMKITCPFIENYERFIEKRENSVSAYRLLIKKIDRLCEWVGIAMIITLLFGTPPFLFYTLINYYILDMGKESFYLFIPVKWPFDWKTPLGYFVAWLAQTAGATVMILTSFIFLNFIFGSFWLFIFMAEDITKDLAAFTIDVRTNANLAEWKKNFRDIIQIYSNANEFIYEFNAIVKYSLFSTFFLLLLTESNILLILQFQLMDNNVKLIETVMASILALWTFGALFFMCEHGERITYHFDVFSEQLMRRDWHTLPIKMQRMYLIFLSDTQQPKNITCYGNILLTRETFKKTTNKAWSYFMTLRKFET